jgi:diguanylate cyclase (GGDEF)-like protein
MPALYATLATSVIAALAAFAAIFLWRDNRQLRSALDTQRTRDLLTGIYNRPYFMELAEREINRAQRTGRHVAVLIVDIDGCKKLNEEYGHHGGDMALTTLAEQAQGAIRDYDLLGRFSGEEVAIVLPDTNETGALIVAERLREKLAAHPVMLRSGECFTVSVSIGMAITGSEMDTLDDALLAADAALHAAKKNGPGHTQSHCG